MPEQGLTQYVQSLWKAAGRPSSRQLSADTGLSHVTTNEAVRRGGGSWQTVELVVKALRGDVEYAGRLWDTERSRPCGVPQEEPPLLVQGFGAVLRDWADHDVALFALGRALGLFASAGFDEFQRQKHVFWSNNRLGNLLDLLMNELIEEGLVEFDSHLVQYRWAPGVADRVRDLGLSRSVARSGG